jgi:selenide,water dikinase
MTDPTPEFDLLSYAPVGGCARKVPPDRLADLLSRLDSVHGFWSRLPQVLLDGSGRDDAGLYEMPDGRLLAATIDMGTPISNSPDVWGRVTAAHVLSDIYAMGALPMLALGLVGWPSALPAQVVATALESATQVLNSESTPVLGGHTVDSREPLLGFAVVGTAQRHELMLIRNAAPGDVLLLTKPLGSGVMITGIKAGLVDDTGRQGIERVMTATNRQVSRLAVAAGVTAATDVTGFGLIGHLRTMLLESKASAQLYWDQVPVIPEAGRLVAEDALVPRGAERNYFSYQHFVHWNDCPLELRFIMADPQTSGGLLLCVPHARVDALLAEFVKAELPVSVIGRVAEGSPGQIEAVVRREE